MRRHFQALILLTAGCGAVSGGPDAAWTLARSPHFEVYSQESDKDARAALTWFELLHSFFRAETNLALDDRPPLRVILFHSPEHFAEYRLSPASDAYYAGDESRDSILMCFRGPNTFGVAAHEYVHAVLHASGVRLPAWLSEGLAEFFSTIQITSQTTSIGGIIPGRVETLKHAWLPIRELLAITGDSPFLEDRARGAVFYAQSWALTHMLALAPSYRAQFPALIQALASGTPSEQGLREIYNKSLDEVNRDAVDWAAARNGRSLTLPPMEWPVFIMKVSAVPFSEVQFRLAEVLLATGNLDRAAAIYDSLRGQAAEPGAVAAGLGEIALRRGDLTGAARHWKEAVAQGINDASICYRFAVIGQQQGLNPGEVRTALDRAIRLRPAFDEARYLLALLEMNAGHYDEAVGQFRAMNVVSSRRAYFYWNGLAYSLLELDRRDEAKLAAAEAARHASTSEERTHAVDLDYMASTDVAVRFVRDEQGREHMATVRVPHGRADWNPFIEPGDRIRRIEGTLRAIECGAKALQIVVDAAGGPVVLTINDPSRVQMRNAPGDFVCGPQSPRTVRVEYAAADDGAGGIVRGIEFL